MTDDQFELIKNRIRPVFSAWLCRLWLSQWNINQYYYRTRDVYERDTPSNVDGSSTACVKVSWEYEDASVHWNCDRIHSLDYTDDELRYVIVHELTHCLLNEMRMWGPSEMDSEKLDEAMKHEERVVTRMAKAYCFVWDEAFRAGQESMKNGEQNGKI